MMSGRGEVLGPSLKLPPLFAVLVNPGVACPTAAVFKALEQSKAKCMEELEDKFNLDYHFKAIDTIFTRVFGE